MPRKSQSSTGGLDHLWRRFWQERSSEVRERLLSHYNYLIGMTSWRIAPRLPPGEQRTEDLYQEGFKGLARAVDQFDPRRGVKFETYAISLIRAAMYDYVRNQDWVPRTVRDRQKKVSRATAYLLVRLGRNPTLYELAQCLGVSVDEMYALLAPPEAEDLVSLDVPGGDTEDGAITVSSALQCPKRRPEESVLSQVQVASISRYVHRLPEREQTVIVLYYYEDMTFKRIARMLKVSESRIFQLHVQALQRMRSFSQMDRALFV